jgi:lysophospholipase
VTVRNDVTVYEDLFYTKDGIHLRYRSWLPREPRTIVIFVHGAGEHIEKYVHIGEHLSREGHACTVYDLRGFGKSGGRRGHVSCFDEYLRDLEQLIDFFKRHLGRMPIFLAGHSLGGLIVTRYVQHKSKQVNGIILSAPALGFNLKIPSLAVRMVRFASYVAPSLSVNHRRLTNKIQEIPYFKHLFPEKVDPVLKDPLMCPVYSIRWVEELLKHAQKAVQHAADIVIPVLCLHGDEDPLISLDVVRAFFDNLAVQEKHWVLIRGAQHVLFHSEQLAAVDAVIHWLNKSVHRGASPSL